MKISDPRSDSQSKSSALLKSIADNGRKLDLDVGHLSDTLSQEASELKSLLLGVNRRLDDENPATKPDGPLWKSITEIGVRANDFAKKVDSIQTEVKKHINEISTKVSTFEASVGDTINGFRGEIMPVVRSTNRRQIGET